MRQFYLYKNSSGYYNAVFVDPISGKKGTDKSTHTKDKIQATVIASGWLEHGIPGSRGNSRSFTAEKTSSSLNLKDIAERVNQDEAQELITLLSKKFNLAMQQTVPEVVEPAPVEIKKTVKTPIQKPHTPGIPLSSFLLNFWDYEKSDFIKRYIAHGHSMTKRHTDNMLSLVRNYWQPYFGNEII